MTIELIQEDYHKDLTQLFQDLYKDKESKNHIIIWEHLYHAKISNWFDNDYYQNWLMKFLYLPHQKGIFVLSYKEIIFEICGFDEETIGVYLQKRLGFSLLFSGHEKFVTCIQTLIEMGVFFDVNWLTKIIENRGLFELESSLENNNKNYYNYLKRTLPEKAAQHTIVKV